MQKEIPGWRAAIYAGTWKRVFIDNIPQWWAIVWLLAGIVQVGGAVYAWGFRAGLFAAGVVFAQKQGLQWLTRNDPQWDDVVWATLVAKVTRRSRRHYAAG